MLLTEAVISFAAGAITEFKLRVILIGLATDGAFVFIKLCLLFTPDAL